MGERLGADCGWVGERLGADCGWVGERLRADGPLSRARTVRQLSFSEFSAYRAAKSEILDGRAVADAA